MVSSSFRLWTWFEMHCSSLPPRVILYYTQYLWSNLWLHSRFISCFVLHILFKVYTIWTGFETWRLTAPANSQRPAEQRDKPAGASCHLPFSSLWSLHLVWSMSTSTSFPSFASLLFLLSFPSDFHCPFHQFDHQNWFDCFWSSYLCLNEPVQHNANA